MAYARSGDDARWPEGLMPYEISSDFDAGQTRTISQAIAHWNRMTIMRLVRRSGQADFVRFVPAEDSCSSNVGRVGGQQNIGCDVGDGFSRGSVVHEIGHGAGYFHEQQRPDRDMFITVLNDNIEDGKESNFAIRMGGVILGPYDYGSIMHYPRDAFADGGFTIVPPPGVDIGQRDGLSEWDVRGVCVMYGAPHFVVAFEDDHDTVGRSDILWAGISRWGKFCWRPEAVSGDASKWRVDPNVAIDDDRAAVVVWQEGKTTGKILAQCTTLDGSVRFDTIEVARGGGSHRAPDVALAPDGNMVVVWQVRSGATQAIRARGFDRMGNERFAAVTVAEGDVAVPGAAAVEVDAAGRFVVVWGELENESLSVKARGYRSDGTPRFGEITVASALGDQDVFPRVGVASDATFVVVYENRMRDVFARGFASDGSERFAEQLVTSHDAGPQLLADVVATATGEFAVVWTDDRNQNGLGQARARVFDANGTETVPEFAANPRGGGDQITPRIAVTTDGSTYVAWADDEDRNGVFQVHATGFNRLGERTLRSVTVNTRWPGQQRHPAIAAR